MSLDDSKESLVNLLEDLWTAISEEYPEDASEPDPLVIERQMHEAFAEERSHLHIGLVEETELLTEHVTETIRQPVFITGESSSDKFSFLSEAVWSIQYIMSWLEMHPDKKNNNAMLWVNSENKPISYQAVRKQLIRITIRAGINKKITPHLFRHSRATFLARHLTEAEMNIYFGWVQGSDMAATYVHLSGRDVDKSILKAHGIIVEEDNNNPKVQQCPRCRGVNGPEALFCFKCGAAMTLKTAMSIEADKSEISTELMTAILKDPGVLAAIKNAMQSEN